MSGIPRLLHFPTGTTVPGTGPPGGGATGLTFVIIDDVLYLTDNATALSWEAPVTFVGPTALPSGSITASDDSLSFHYQGGEWTSPATQSPGSTPPGVGRVVNDTFYITLAGITYAMPVTASIAVPGMPPGGETSLVVIDGVEYLRIVLPSGEVRYEQVHAVPTPDAGPGTLPDPLVIAGGLTAGQRLDTPPPELDVIFYRNAAFGRAYLPPISRNNVVVYIGGRIAPEPASDAWDLDSGVNNDNLYGIAAEAAFRNSGNVTTNVAGWFQAFSGDDGNNRTLDRQVGVIIATPDKAGTLTINNAYGLLVSAPTIGAVSNIGIYNQGTLLQEGSASFTSILPISDRSYDLGSAAKRFCKLWIAGSPGVPAGIEMDGNYVPNDILWTVDGNGDVGAPTKRPNRVYAKTQFVGPAGSAGVPSVIVGAGVDGMFSPGAGTLAFSANGTTRLTLNANGAEVPDDAYNATTWNGNLSVPTKNAVRDKIEALSTLVQGASDGTYSGTTLAGIAGDTLAFGDLVTLDKDDSRWEKVDISVAALATGDARGLLAIAVTSGTDGSAITVLLSGVVRADANFPALTIGAPVYASTTGDLVVTQPATVDHVIRIVGHALTADELLFRPDNSWMTHT